MKLDYKYAESMVEPSEIEFCKNTVYIRKNILQKKRTHSDETITVWVYREAVLTREEFEEYSKLIETKKAFNDENQIIIMEAIADLYDVISSIQGGTA